MIYSQIGKNLEDCENPKEHGKALAANLKGYWRCRVGDCRIIADIQDDKIVILILTSGHRSEVYPYRRTDTPYLLWEKYGYPVP